VRATDRPARITDEPYRAGKPLGWIGAAAVLTAAGIAGALPVSHAPARVLILAVVVGCCAAVLPDVRVTLALAGVAYVLANGFLSGEDTATSVHSAESVWNLVVLGIATGLGLGQRWMRAAQTDADLDAELRDLIDEAVSDADNEGGSR